MKAKHPVPQRPSDYPGWIHPEQNLVNRPEEPFAASYFEKSPDFLIPWQAATCEENRRISE